MKKFFSFYIILIALNSIIFTSNAQNQESQIIEKSVPIFENGEAQIVNAFNDPEKWIRHDLWVETVFDTDGDGKLDRMHVGSRTISLLSFGQS